MPIVLPECRLAEGALRRAPHAAALHRHGLADEPVAHRCLAGAAPGARAAAGRHALCRQADHRRGRAAGADAGPAGDAARLADERPAQLAGLCCCSAEFALAVLSDVLGRVVSLVDSLLSERFTNATSVRLMEHAATLDLEDFEDSELQDQLERARRQTSGPHDADGQLFGQAQDIVTVVELRRRPARLRAVADRAAAGRAGAGVPRRGAFQRAELLARLRPHAGAARARLRAPDRRERRDRQGSEDLRPQRAS